MKRLGITAPADHSAGLSRKSEVHLGLPLFAASSGRTARYVHTPCENSKLSHDLDVIVKSRPEWLREESVNFGPAARVPVSVENKRIAHPQAKVRVGP